MGDIWQKGGCLCGAVRYTLAAEPKWTALCHCETCRRAASSAIVAWMGHHEHTVTWDGSRQFFASSPTVKRSFCPTCGSPLSFEGARWPGEVHIYAATLDDPSVYVPELHCYTAEHLDWLNIDDNLPRFEGTGEPVTQ